MIIATAGHIDHGKTTLVKALTGVDTDRLPQEKARGISIDLGFAYWTEPGGEVLGFVDVPGHERFVRNMLAGVCAIDYALLLIAADDGVMPQTREHLHIVDLLGIRDGIVVISKADRADPQQLARVREQARALLAGTSLEGAELLPVSGTTGAGIDDLRARLAAAAQRRGARQDEGRRLRYSVDRAFSRTGSGTVVTGTVFDGFVQVGDRLLVSPAGHEVRVRGIQQQGRAVGQAGAGERCALNLAGLELAKVRRGDWVLHPQLHAPGTRLDVDLRVLVSETQDLQHWTPVHLHLGTGEVGARVSLRRGASVPVGERGFARLVLDAPVVAAHGDRFILRDQSARRTIGGGVVLDAQPAARRLAPQAWSRQLQALCTSEPHEALVALLACRPGGVGAAAFARNFKLGPQALAQAVERAGLALVGTGDAAVVLSPECARERLVRSVPAAAPASPEHARLWDLLVPVLRAQGRAGGRVAELAQAVQAREPVLRDVLHRKVRTGEAVQVGDDRFVLRGAMDELVSLVRGLAASVPGGRFTAGQFRDACGLGRALSVQVLEAIDRLGVTQRVGDARVLRTASRVVSPAPAERLQGEPIP